MNGKKHFITYIGIIWVAAILFSGCGSTNSTVGKDTNQSTQSGSAQETKQEGQKYMFRLAETHPADYPTTMADKYFAQLVKERSNGRITIEVFPSAQLGEEKAAIEQVQLGAIEFARVSSGALAAFNKDLGVFSLPYIFDSDEHVWNFLLSEDGNKLLDSLESSKMKGLAYYSSGARSFYSRKPITKLEDLKGLKIRVIQNSINLDLHRSAWR